MVWPTTNLLLEPVLPSALVDSGGPGLSGLIPDTGSVAPIFECLTSSFAQHVELTISLSSPRRTITFLNSGQVGVPAKLDAGSEQQLADEFSSPPDTESVV